MHKKGLALVLATTGLSDEQLAHVQEAGKTIPIVQSYNMSLGINTLAKIVELITPVLADAGFDIEIVEKHHNQKLDAPSGTALALADAINEELDNSYVTSLTVPRSAKSVKRKRSVFLLCVAVPLWASMRSSLPVWTRSSPSSIRHIPRAYLPKVL